MKPARRGVRAHSVASRTFTDAPCLCPRDGRRRRAGERPGPVPGRRGKKHAPWLFFAVVALLPAARVSAQECYCDRWFSTNTRTLDIPNFRGRADVAVGMSYEGPKSETFNGITCMRWADVFERCTAGFEEQQLEALASYSRSYTSELLASFVLSAMSPDRLGMTSSGLFEDADAPGLGHNRCRSTKHGVLLEPSLEESGPFCFVDANDPRAVNFTRANGWLQGPSGFAMEEACPEVTPVPCGISRCAPDAESASEVGCERATASAGGGSARLLMANGAMELWARRTHANGLVRNAELTRNPPTTWADVTYSEYPNFPEGANPAEPRFWDLCLFGGGDIERQGLGYNASTDGANVGHLLHKLGALVQCDAVVPRAQGVSLSEHSPGRGGGTTSAARVAFVKASDTAALKAEHGAMAAMAPNAVHVARAWVRCAKGSATVALVVSRLPETARTSEDEATVTHYDAFENVRSGSGNVLACDVAASAYTATSDAPEAVSGWTQLEVAVRSAKAEHEVTVQVVVQSHSNDAAVLIDDVEFEVEAADASSVCAGGGGAGVSYKAAHKCSSDPTHLFYDLRERGGVPVAFEQVHAMVRIGFRSVSCKKPTLDATSAAECAFLSQATLPHLGADEVRAYMDARSDDELAAEMGWAEEGARGPGVLAGASVAVGILRAGLPDAIATGVIRTVDGPEYNIHGTPADSPSSGPSPTSGIAWHAMSSSSDFKTLDDSSPSWRICSDHLGHRQATCYAWSIADHLMGCEIIPTLLLQPNWGEFVHMSGGIAPLSDSGKLEPQSQTLRELLFHGTFVASTNDVEVDTDVLPPGLVVDVQNRAGQHLRVGDGGEYICASSFNVFTEQHMRGVASAVQRTAASLGSATPQRRSCETPLNVYWASIMRAFLPWSAPAGETCVSFVDIDFTSDNLYASHVDTGASDALGGFPHVLVIAAVIFCACCLYAARRYMLRVARIFRGWRHYPQATVFSQRVFSTCKHIALVGVGAQSEVYMSEITVWGKTRQIASKMYYRQANAKAEMVMYERLPFHENILRVHGVFADTVMNNRWCLAMEYCRHGNVRESMRSGKFPRNGGFAHHLISGVVSALGALHGNAMAHRDVKLDNVLLHCPCEGSSACACLSTNSRDVRAKLADFDMARQGTMMAMSSENVKGTLMYIPPERVQYDKSKHGEGFYELADVYALGMMIWETLYYVRHGEVVSVMEKILPGCREGQDVLIAISSGAFTPPCDFLPEPLRRFLRKSWHFSPSERYQRCACMHAAWEEMRDTVCALSFGADDVAVDATRGERAASEKG